MLDYKIRPAEITEISELNKLIVDSAKGLSLNEYTKEEIDGLIRYVFGIDSELIEDKTYFVIEKAGMYAACGGWSKRKTLFGGDSCQTRESGYLNASTDAAKIRAFFVHPDFARQGLAKTLIDACENAAKEAGFKRMELMSTLPGVKFYQSQGYVGVEKIDYPLPNGKSVQFIPMSKRF